MVKFGVDYAPYRVPSYKSDDAIRRTPQMTVRGLYLPLNIHSFI